LGLPEPNALFTSSVTVSVWEEVQNGLTRKGGSFFQGFSLRQGIFSDFSTSRGVVRGFVAL
jgi:hypothetical protein